MVIGYSELGRQEGKSYSDDDTTKQASQGTHSDADVKRERPCITCLTVRQHLH